MTQGPQLIVVNSNNTGSGMSGTNANNIHTIHSDTGHSSNHHHHNNDTTKAATKVTTRSNGSVETTERCSTDGTDPLVAAANEAAPTLMEKEQFPPRNDRRPVEETPTTPTSASAVQVDRYTATNENLEETNRALDLVEERSPVESSSAEQTSPTNNKGPRTDDVATATNASSSPQQLSIPRIDLNRPSAAALIGGTDLVDGLPNMLQMEQSNNTPYYLQEQEQALFEQRLCDDPYGIAIRKINQYGKSHLRYVRCITVDETTKPNSSRSGMSVSSWVVRRGTAKANNHHGGTQPASIKATPYRVLAWGKKKDVQISLKLFTAVRMGKATERGRRCPAPSNHVLSLITVDPKHTSLDIEAPTQLDRDKFARAFARFLGVPLRDTDGDGSLEPPRASNYHRHHPTMSLLGAARTSHTLSQTALMPPPMESLAVPEDGSFDQQLVLPRSKQPKSMLGKSASNISDSHKSSSPHEPHPVREATVTMTTTTTNQQQPQAPPPPQDVPATNADVDNDNDDNSRVSSLTGHGYDQELVEELHHALNELRLELDESRLEAARAVKVAEQAIQSAEKSNSAEWQNTVTHKAAEAAAMAQKRSAGALAKQRLAEERLDGERRSASFWRKQAELAEEEAGALQTRAAAAEVQRAAAAEQLQCERRVSALHLETLKQRYRTTDESQRKSLEVALEKNRVLDLQLNSTGTTTGGGGGGVSRPQDGKEEEATEDGLKSRKKRGFGRKKKTSPSGSPDSAGATSSNRSLEIATENSRQLDNDGYSKDHILNVQTETRLMRRQFELLKKATAEQLEQLPEQAKTWGDQVTQALQSTQTELSRLQDKLAMESASRRKLLHEVQDLRGAVRVYCRPKPQPITSNSSSDTDEDSVRLLSLPSQDTLMVHRDTVQDDALPVSFEFDRVFDLQSQQLDVYNEIEDVCLGVLDGYNICLLACGPKRCGKTSTLLGEVIYNTDAEQKIEIQNHGIQLRAIEQLFSVAELRNDRYKDVFSLTVVEVYDERVRDLLMDTETGDSRGKIVVVDSKNGGKDKKKNPKALEDDESSSKPSKLEIRTDIHGNTVVQGLVSVDVESFDDVSKIWEEVLETKSNRLAEQGFESREFDDSCHVIATLTVNSSNIATGICTVGRIQFADLAAADIVPRRASPDTEPQSSSQSEWRFANRSLETLSECVEARLQFNRSVPYRNSTLTHLLRDSLEADTKVILITCVSSDPKDLPETLATLKFATRMRRVTIGKATKHTLCPP